MKDKIIDFLGNEYCRKKYERQGKFKRRVYKETIENIKKLYKHDFKDCEENAVIVKFPFFINGYIVLANQYCIKRVKKEGIQYKYITLKLGDLNESQSSSYDR